MIPSRGESTATPVLSVPGSDAAAPPPDARERRWRIAAGAFGAAIAALMLGTFLDYGVTWDEELMAWYGDVALRWYTSLFRDASALVDFAHQEGGAEHFYGAAFDLVVQAAVRVSPLGSYETRHLVTVLTALAGLAATYRLGRLLGGARSGLFAAVLLAASPAWYGHAFANPKDIPFATLHAWVLVLALETAPSLPAVPWRRVAALGIALGLALGVRIGGAFVLAYVAVAWGATLLGHGRAPGAVARAVGGARRLAAAVAIAWAVLLLSWPGAQPSPIAAPLSALLEVGRSGTMVRVLFDGATVLSTDLPRSYLPTWIAVTLPETWLVASAAALFVGIRALRRPGPDRTRWIRVGVLGLSVAFPVAFAIATRPNDFDGWRHFLFVVPPLAALVADGFARFVLDPPVPRALRIAAGSLAAGALALVAVDMVRLHPYESVYFNRLVGGGLAGAAGRFETDYWGASHREGIEWLLAHTPGASPALPFRVASCSRQFLVAYPLSRDPRGAGFRAVAMNEGPDVVLATTRHGCAASLAEAGWRPLHAVERMGVPLLFVLRSPFR